MDSETVETPNASGEAGRTFSRRQILKVGAGLASLGLGYSLFPQHLQEALAQPTTCGKLNDIDHIVIFIQENRSFDHYFGSYRGVRGFSDPGVKRQANGRSVFYQPDPTNTTNPPSGYLLPFHLDTKKTNAACTHDISHDWVPQHQSWNNGKMDGFVQAHRAANQQDGTLTMGYYTRADLPFYYAVADAFTICDNYHCSVMGQPIQTASILCRRRSTRTAKTAGHCCKPWLPTARPSLVGSPGRRCQSNFKPKALAGKFTPILARISIRTSYPISRISRTRPRHCSKTPLVIVSWAIFLPLPKVVIYLKFRGC